MFCHRNQHEHQLGFTRPEVYNPQYEELKLWEFLERLGSKRRLRDNLSLPLIIRMVQIKSLKLVRRLRTDADKFLYLLHIIGRLSLYSVHNVYSLQRNGLVSNSIVVVLPFSYRLCAATHAPKLYCSFSRYL